MNFQSVVYIILICGKSLTNTEKITSAEFKSRQYNVGGLVSLMDNKVKIKGFSYSGEGPDAFFYVGTSGVPSGNGFKIDYPVGSGKELGKYTNQDLEFSLPAGVKAENVAWVSVWCKKFAVNFGEVFLGHSAVPPTTTPLPPPTEGDLTSRKYNVNGRVILLNGKIVIEGFSYTGAAPDAFFYVGTSGIPSGEGHKISYPEGSGSPLGAYTDERVEFSLPTGVSSTDVAWVSVWCRDYKINFGEVYFNEFSKANVERIGGLVVALFTFIAVLLL